MYELKQKVWQYFWTWAIVTLVTLTFSAWGVQSAEALLRQHHDSPGVLRYHSQVSIKDEKGYTWQVLLFKQDDKSTIKDLRLRLVGFPGIVEIAHPQPLVIETTSGKLLSASDVYGLTAPAPNVGEYELTNILTQLGTTDALKLYVPTDSVKPLLINIPQNLVTEWQWLVTEIE